MTTPATSPVPVKSAEGRDVSNFQGQYDWAKAAADGACFGIYRLTQGLGGSGDNSPDPTAVWNFGQLKSRGLHHGAYHYLDPALSGADQAGYFVAQHKLLGLDTADMLWLDNETPAASPAAVAACAREFMDELDRLCPYNPRGVYTYIDFARQGNCAGLEGDPLWLAYPNAAAPVAPPPWTRWTFWQWGTRDGTDADAFNGTAAQLASWIGSFAPKPAPVPRPPVPWQVEALARLEAVSTQVALVAVDAANLGVLLKAHQS